MNIYFNLLDYDQSNIYDINLLIKGLIELIFVPLHFLCKFSKSYLFGYIERSVESSVNTRKNFVISKFVVILSKFK